MDKLSYMKPISQKKIQNILQQSPLKQQKNYQPGKLQFQNTQHCQANLVNFFGDVRTQVFSARVNQEDTVIIGCSNGQVRQYNTSDGHLLNIGNTSRMSGYPCTSVRWKPIHHSQFVACNCDGTIKWFRDNQAKSYGHCQRNDVSYLCADYQIKQQWCIFGTDRNTIQVIDNQTFKTRMQFDAGSIHNLNVDHHVNRVFSVKCMPDDSNLFFSGGWDSTIQIWDVRQGGGSVRQINGPLITSDSLDYHKGMLLVGNYSNNSIAQLYDYGSGSLIRTLDIGEPKNSTSYAFAASFAHRSQHNILAVAVSGSNSVKILKDQKLVNTIKLQATPLTIDFYRWNNKDFLILGGLQGTVYCVKINLHQ